MVTCTGLMCGGNRLTCRLGVTDTGRSPTVPQVKLSGLRPVRKVLQAASGEVSALARPLPITDASQFESKLRHQRMVVDRGRVRPSGADQLFGGLPIAH